LTPHRASCSTAMAPLVYPFSAHAGGPEGAPEGVRRDHRREAGGDREGAGPAGADAGQKATRDE